MMKSFRYFFLLILGWVPFVVHAVTPEVSNVQASQRRDGSRLVDISYDLTGNVGEVYRIQFHVTRDGGTTLEDVIKTLSGDVVNVSPGTNKQVVWNIGADLPDYYAQIQILVDIYHPPPTADAGLDQSVSLEKTVTLNGANSQPSNSGSALTYSWTMASRPAGSGANLSNRNTATPSFTPDKEGSYVFTLTVYDGLGTASDTVTIKASDAPEGFVRIPAGTFTMGDIHGSGESNENPPHSVTISQDFFIMEREVTAAEYKACVDAGGCSYSGSTTNSLRTYNVTGKENHPINYVSWNDAQVYIVWKNQVDPGHGYRLCTEAEWEYAARAGTTTRWSCGDSESCLFSVSWHKGNNTPEGPKAVKTKQPNAWGLYDMHGNIWEWVEDWYSGSYYNTISNGVTDPMGPSTGSYRVLRGGHYGTGIWQLVDGNWSTSGYAVTDVRSAVRYNFSPALYVDIIGFRLCST